MRCDINGAKFTQNKLQQMNLSVNINSKPDEQGIYIYIYIHQAPIH